MMSLSHFMIGCFSENQEPFADDSLLKESVFGLSFPSGLMDRSTPDSAIIIGPQKVSAALFEIGEYTEIQ